MISRYVFFQRFLNYGEIHSLRTSGKKHIEKSFFVGIGTGTNKKFQFEYFKFSGCIKNSPLNSPLPIPKEGQQHPHASMMRPALPEFTAGAGYLIPGEFVPELYLASLSTKFIPVEDAFTTGYCAKKIGLHPPMNDHRFSCGQLVVKNCDMIGLFTGHKVTPDRMNEIYDELELGNCL